jgi:hypothetical protein
MADKLGVSIDYVVKTIFDKSITADIKKAMSTKIETAINKSSKLEVDYDTKKGFSMTVTLELTKDDKTKPPQIKGTIAMAIVGTGLTAGTINLKTPAQGDAGNPAKPLEPSRDVVEAILDNMIPKVIKAMEAKAP